MKKNKLPWIALYIIMILAITLLPACTCGTPTATSKLTSAPISTATVIPSGATNIRGMVTSSGRFLNPVTAFSKDNLCKLDIPTGTIGLTVELAPLTEITIRAVDNPPSLPESGRMVGLAYDCGPNGASFDPAIIITFTYNPADIPADISVNDLILAFYNQAENKWITLNNIIINATAHTISGTTTHFTTFQIMALVPILTPDPTPTLTTEPVLTTTPTPTLTTTPAPTPNPTPADNIAPAASTIVPNNGAIGVAINSNITATFSEALDPLTVTTATFSLTQGVTPVPGSVSYIGGIAIFNPDVDLTPGTLYTVTITTGVKDLAGNALQVNKVWSFTTAAAPDTTAPTVSSTVPANDGMGVAVSDNLTVTFSEAMNHSTVTTVTFTITQGVTVIPGEVTYVDLVATFNPDADLMPSTVYTATITTGAKDLAGNPLAVAKVWSFITAAWNYTAWTDQGIVYAAPSGDAYYPSVLYEANGFENPSAKYAMWYTDGSGAVFMVTSSNGTSWSVPTTITGLGGDAHHVQVLYDANRFSLCPLGPKYRIWYWDIDAQLYGISAIATAQSVDGINWNNDTALSQDPSAQLITGAGTGWNRGSYGPVSLFYKPEAANTGTDPWRYSYIMYYDGTDGSHEATGLAYSADGFFWKAYSGDPVLPVSAVPAWDSDDSVYGTVYRDALGFHYWYSGGVSTPYDGIGYALSVDGITWIKDPNYVFHVSEAVSYRNQRVYTPAIIDDGTGVLKMYYTAKGTVGPKQIGYAILSP